MASGKRGGRGQARRRRCPRSVTYPLRARRALRLPPTHAAAGPGQQRDLTVARGLRVGARASETSGGGARPGPWGEERQHVFGGREGDVNSEQLARRSSANLSEHVPGRVVIRKNHEEGERPSVDRFALRGRGRVVDRLVGLRSSCGGGVCSSRDENGRATGVRGRERSVSARRDACGARARGRGWNELVFKRCPMIECSSECRRW